MSLLLSFLLARLQKCPLATLVPSKCEVQYNGMEEDKIVGLLCLKYLALKSFIKTKVHISEGLRTLCSLH